MLPLAVVIGLPGWTLQQPSPLGKKTYSSGNAVREFVNKLAASAASLDYVKFQPRAPSSACRAVVRGLPWVLVPDFWSSWRLR